MSLKDAMPSANRPLRTPVHLTLTVGQTEGDLRGADDKIIQAGIDYLAGMGGGTLRILPGVYTLHNAIRLRSGITLSGSGEQTILRKARGGVTPLTGETDAFEYAVKVKDPTLFVPGGGIMLRSQRNEWLLDVLQATVTRIEGDLLFLDTQALYDFYDFGGATAAAIFPLLTAENVHRVRVEGLVLDGNREQNEHIDGQWAAAVFIKSCHDWRFENVVARSYNGDGFACWACNRVRLEKCRAQDNADSGFRIETGCTGPVLRGCAAEGNAVGMHFGTGVADAVVEDNTFTNCKSEVVDLRPARATDGAPAIRDRKAPLLTVGQNGGDLRGADDKALQAGIEYLHRVGGGTLKVLPGVYEIHNALYLRPGVTICGSGPDTVLRKAPSAAVPLAADTDAYEFGARIAEAKPLSPDFSQTLWPATTRLRLAAQPGGFC